MKLLEVNCYLEEYDDIVVFFIEEDVYKYGENLFKSSMDKDYYFTPNRLTRIFKSWKYLIHINRKLLLGLTTNTYLN